jgi:hypothetical protein
MLARHWLLSHPVPNQIIHPRMRGHTARGGQGRLCSPQLSS